MSINLTKTYTVKSNAQADIRKAIAKGECVAGEFTVTALSGGFRIVPHDTGAEAARWDTARWPAGTTPGLARLRANGHAEKIRQAVLADQEKASADAAAAIVTEGAAAMVEALAAGRDALADEAHALHTAAEMPADLIEEAMRRGVSPAQFAEVAERVAQGRVGPFGDEDRAAIWTVLQGLTPVAADGVEPSVFGGTLREDQAENAKRRKARVERAKQDRAVKARRVEKAVEASRIEVEAGERRAAAKRPAPPAAPADLSAEATKLLLAVFHSPALRDLAPEAKVGKWIAYKTIHASDRPHGLNVRRVPGYMTTLSRRGLVECRAEKAGQYSACVTAAGLAALALDVEAGR
jgi:hypothetical protein